MIRRLGVACVAIALAASPLHAQVQVRLADSVRGTYSELHDGLKMGSASADTVARILAIATPAPLWRRAALALSGKVPWNEGLLALTRLAELRTPVYADSADKLMQQIINGEVKGPPGIDPGDLIEPLRAVTLEAERNKVGDAALRTRILTSVPSGKYGLADAWVLGRLGAGTADTLMQLLSAAPDENLKVRYLTLLSFSDDPVAIPMLAAVYSSPDSAGIPVRAATRASDALLWIGTKQGMEALAAARDTARAARDLRLEAAVAGRVHLPGERQLFRDLANGPLVDGLDCDAQGVAVERGKAPRRHGRPGARKSDSATVRNPA